MRSVYYSLANVPEIKREQQWIQSIRSLRLYNATIPVWLILFNDASRQLLREAERQKVRLRILGDYAEFLCRLHSKGSIIALYPTFHKFLALDELPLDETTQLLYLDCDTFFFDDVELLFEHHASHDCYAREEPHSSRSSFPYDPQHVDELLLRYIARSENLRYIPPFNSGVCLMNHQSWHSLSRLGETQLNIGWRLLCGMELSGREYESQDPKVRSAVMDAITDTDRANALQTRLQTSGSSIRLLLG
jgi:hypothetical protein